MRLRAAECGRLRSRISRRNGCAIHVALCRAPLPLVRTHLRPRIISAHDIFKVVVTGHHVWTRLNIEFYKDAADAVFKALVE